MYLYNKSTKELHRLAVLLFLRGFMAKQVFTNKEYTEFPYLHFFCYQNINGSHSFRYHRNGTQKNICCKDLEKAKIKVKEFCKQLAKNNGTMEKQDFTTLCEYGRKWLDVDKKPNVHKDTYRVYNGVFKNYICPTFENKYFREISFFDLQDFFNKLPTEKGKTIENIKIVMRGIYDSAYIDGMIDKNIMERVQVKRHIRKKGQCLSIQAEKDFISKIKGNTKELSWLVLLYSGVRPCELSSIEFDWQNNEMTIKNGKLKRYQTTFYRTIPIFPHLKALKTRLENEDWKKNTRTMSCRFPRVCPNYRLYDLRHTFVTRAKQCGVCDELVSQWTGHELGKSVTAKVYTHYDMNFQQKEALKVFYDLEKI